MPAPLPPPGPRGHWLLGTLPEWRADILGFYTRCARDHGDIVGLRMANRRVALVSHPDGIEEVLATKNRHFVKNFAQRALAPWLGNGLLLSEGDVWLRQRRLIQPAFRRERVASYAETMVALTRRMLDTWRDGETRDVHDELTRLTLAIAARTLFDADVSDRASEVTQALLVMMDDFNTRFRGLFAAPLWLPTPTNLRTRRGLLRLRAVIDRIIAERRGSGADRGDLLSILLQARDEEGDGGRMSDGQLRDEVVTLLLAGHDTTANALTWTWYLLATHPPAAERLAAEVRDVLGDRPPTAADLPRLPYAEHVVAEAMRLYPPVYGFGRESVQETEVMGYRIPKGWNVVMSQWVVQRDPRWFPDPERFDPDRWAGDRTQRLPRYAYFPFGGGPRLCIGNAFAQMEAVLVLATVAREYHFTIDPAHPVEPQRPKRCRNCCRCASSSARASADNGTSRKRPPGSSSTQSKPLPQQQCLYCRPLPQGQGALRESLRDAIGFSAGKRTVISSHRADSTQPAWPRSMSVDRVRGGARPPGVFRLRKPSRGLQRRLHLDRRQIRQDVERTGSAGDSLARHVCVDHGGFQARVPEQLLDRADIDTALHQVRREAVAERVAMNGRAQAGGAPGLGHRALDGSRVDMMPPRATRPRTVRQLP